jgi:hypothetical protein
VSARSQQVYVNYTISKCYRLVAIKLGRKCSEDVIEEVLLAALEGTHNDILAHVQGQEAREDAFRKSIEPMPGLPDAKP